MRVTTCTINLGKGLENRTLVMHLFYFVDVFCMMELLRKCNDTTIGSYSHHHLSPNCIPSVTGTGY